MLRCLNIYDIIILLNYKYCIRVFKRLINNTLIIENNNGFNLLALLKTESVLTIEELIFFIFIFYLFFN